MPEATDSQRHKLNRDPVRDPHVILLEFQEDGQDSILRVAVNTEDVTWEGNLYTRAAIHITFPQSGGGDTRAQLAASNVNRALSRALNAATRRISCRLILIDVANDTVPLIDTANLLVIPSASGRADKVTAELAPRASLLEPVPAKRTTKQDFAGIWLA